MSHYMKQYKFPPPIQIDPNYKGSTFSKGSKKTYWLKNGHLVFGPCKHCGQKFWKKSPAAKFCSDNCRIAAHREKQKLNKDRQIHRQCLNCAQWFARRYYTRFCSYKCRLAWEESVKV